MCRTMPQMKDVDIKKIVQKAALLNAVSHGGKALGSSVLGKLLAENPNFKDKIKEFVKEVDREVKEVNNLSTEEQMRILEEKWPGTLITEKKKKVRKSGLPPLHNAEKYERIVTRFSPNPDCVLHLGSARAVILSHEYEKSIEAPFSFDSKTQTQSLRNQNWRFTTPYETT